MHAGEKLVKLNDVNLIRTSTYFGGSSVKSLALDLLTSPFGGLVEKRSTEFFLRKINLAIAPGEKVALLGKNGSGKSTLCKLLAKKFSPSSGELTNTFDTQLFSHLESSFYGELTGHENVTFFINRIFSKLNSAEREKLVAQCCDFSELGSALYRTVETYSSGMRARLSLSLILSKQQDLLILDEIQSHADWSFRKKITDRLEEIITSSNSVIIISHQLEEVESLCTRGIVMNDGQIIFDGILAKAIACYKMTLAGDN